MRIFGQKLGVAAVARPTRHHRHFDPPQVLHPVSDEYGPAAGNASQRGYNVAEGGTRAVVHDGVAATVIVTLTAERRLEFSERVEYSVLFPDVLGTGRSEIR